MLMPEFQKSIDAAYDGLNLSDERRQVLQPKIEQSVQVTKNINYEDSSIHYSMQVVDANGDKRDIKVAELVKEVHSSTSDDSKPVVSAEKLTNEDLQDIASGKKTVNLDEKPKRRKDSIAGSEILNSNVSLEDVASGKQKVDIDF